MLDRYRELRRTQRLLIGYGGATLPEVLPSDLTGGVATDADRIVSSARQSFDETVRAAGLSLKQRKQLFLRAGLWVGVPLALTVLLTNFKLLLALPLGLVLERFLLTRRTYKRAEGFEKDYTAFLLSLASAVRTGQDPIFALCEEYKLFDKRSEIYKELKIFTSNIESGMPEERAIKEFAISIEHPDLNLFRAAMILARREGSSLSQCLQRLARVTRQRQSFRRKVKTAVAVQKLSAIGIAVCVVVIGLIQYSANPDSVQKAFAHPTGSKVIYFGLTLVVVGLVWMRQMSKSRI
ncbi:MAG: type II secretion system F family protein [Bdellovibrionales bacterium]|nr:type II secretion system F family protein [Bdellovibrionales bacterium]